MASASPQVCHHVFEPLMHKDCGPSAIRNTSFAENAVSIENEEIQHAGTQVRIPGQDLLPKSISPPEKNHCMREDKISKRYGLYEFNDSRSVSQKRRNECPSTCGCAKTFKDNSDDCNCDGREEVIGSGDCIPCDIGCKNQCYGEVRLLDEYQADRLPRRTSNRKAQQPKRNYNGVIQATAIRIEKVLNETPRNNEKEKTSSQKRQLDETYKDSETSIVQAETVGCHAVTANSTVSARRGLPKERKQVMSAKQIGKTATSATGRANASDWVTANKMQETASLRDYGKNRNDQMQYTILQGTRIACFLIGGEKRLCMSEITRTVLVQIPLNEIERVCDGLGIYMQQCSPSQLRLLWANRILPMGTTHCTLITQANSERLCHQLLFQRGSDDCPLVVPIQDDDELEPRLANNLPQTFQEEEEEEEEEDGKGDKVDRDDRQKGCSITSHSGQDGLYSNAPLSDKGQTSQQGPSSNPELTNNLAIYAGCCTFVPVSHNCSSYIRGLAFLALYRSVQSACIQCRHCNRFYTPQDFVCHEHKNVQLSNKTRRNSIPRQKGPSVCHWGLDSNKWRAYLDVDKSYADTISSTYASGDDKVNVTRTLICLWQRRLDGMKKVFAGIAEYYDQSTRATKPIDPPLTEELRVRKDFPDMLSKLPLLTFPTTYNPALCIPPLLAPLMLNGGYGSGIAAKRPQRLAPPSDHVSLNPGAMALDIGFDALHRSISQATSKDAECARMINEDLAKLRLLCQHSTSYLLQTNSLLSQSVDRLARENAIMRKELNRFTNMQAVTTPSEMDDNSFGDVRRAPRDATNDGVQWKETAQSNHVK